MSDEKKETKDQTKSPVTGKSAENAAPPSSKNQPATESATAAQHKTTQQQGKGPAQPEPSETKTTGTGGQIEEVDLNEPPAPFVDVDLSDPPPDEPSFEKIEHRDAPHSSYNTQQDHKWKYSENFGKEQKKDGDGKGAK